MVEWCPWGDQGWVDNNYEDTLNTYTSCEYVWRHSYYLRN